MVTMATVTESLVLVILLLVHEVHGQCSGSTLTLTASMTSLDSITSENFPDPYPSNSDCRWEINAGSAGNFVLFYVTDKTLEITVDFLKMYAGTVETGTLVYDSDRARIYPTPYVIATSGSQLTVTFTSDSTTEFGGFRMYYIDIASPPACGSSQTATSTAQQLSFVYRTQASDCRHTISTSTPSFLVEITVLMVEGHVSTEEGGVAETISQVNAVVVSNTSTIDVIGDHGTAYVIQYREVSAGTDAPTVITTPAADIDCGVGNTWIATDTTQYIQSPSYPGPYPQSASCSDVIRSNNSQESVQLTIDDYALNDGDIVTLYDGPSSEYNTLVGSISVNDVVISTSDSMLVKFISNSYGQNRGFKFSYIAVARQAPSCESYDFTLDANLTEQTLSSPNYPNPYGHNLDIYWLITKPNTEDNIVLNFKQMDIESSTNCQFDSVTVFDGHCTTNPVIGKLCGKTPTYYQDSTGLYVLVRFTTDGTGANTGFELTYYIGSVTTSPPRPQGGGLEPWEIALIVIGVVLAVLIIVALIVLLLVKYKSTEPEDEEIQEKPKRTEREIFESVLLTSSQAIGKLKRLPKIKRKRKLKLAAQAIGTLQALPKIKSKRKVGDHPAPNTDGDNIDVISKADVHAHPPLGTLYAPLSHPPPSHVPPLPKSKNSAPSPPSSRPSSSSSSSN